MNTEERLMIPDSPTPQTLFAVERENHTLRETCVLLRGEIVTLKEKLASERRRSEADSNRRAAEERTVRRLRA